MDASDEPQRDAQVDLDGSADANAPDAGPQTTDRAVVDAAATDAEADAGPPWTVVDLEARRRSAAPPACEDDADCDEDLSCLQPIPTLDPVCGRSCFTDEECGPIDEWVCSAAPTGEPTCIERRDEGAFCGIPFGAACKSGMECMPFSIQGTTGACFQECFPMRLETGCPQGVGCIPGWFLQGEPTGICANRLSRGERCDAQAGDSLRCNDFDFCAPDGPESSTWTCRELCDPELAPCLIGECRAFGEQDETQIYACYR
jgi:hypothetical protein